MSHFHGRLAVIQVAILSASFFPNPAAANSATLEGFVVDASGRPAPDCAVTANLVEPFVEDSWSATTITKTDAKGAFRFELRPGTYGVGATEPELGWAFRPGVRIVVESKTRVRLQLSPEGRRLSARLSLPQGKYQASALLTRLDSQDGESFAPQYTSSGFFALLPAGNYLLRVMAPGALAYSEEVALEAGSSSREVELTPLPPPPPEDLLGWVASHKIDFSTEPEEQPKEPLQAVFCQSKVVLLGEATHGTREFFRIKHRLFEYLVQRCGFRVFALETSMADAETVEECLNQPDCDLKSAILGLGVWIWNTEEVLALLQWMRAYNQKQNHEKKLRFYGLDMQNPRAAARRTLSFLSRVDPQKRRANEGWLTWLSTSSGPGQMSDMEAQSLRATASELLASVQRNRASYLDLTSGAGLAAAEQNIRLLVQWADLGPTRSRRNLLRPAFLAENVEWILGRESPVRMVVWAHNGHVRASRSGNAMGSRLRRTLGAELTSCGLFFGHGGFAARDSASSSFPIRDFNVEPDPAATLDETLSKFGDASFVLDLRDAPRSGPVRAWVQAVQVSKQVGSIFNKEHTSLYLTSLRPIDDFDCLVFVPRTSPARQIGARSVKEPR